ncbi:Zinc finger BED domain-containing protein 1 [Merluccius polli]|uniref:Zinc finger BED domain-containing protein 1 n=1 Tax=Merluccius polli TaxID=89951 RepID=A0AA47PD36_MERPO|nr:Zinc finger BED domain-containing protein 1 [Merluccius polli]
MEPARKRKHSPVWEHFDLISANKVKCLLCAKELVYSNNTSSMLRHFRALHADAQANTGAPTQMTRKQELDEALVSMIVGDTQPFTVVEDQGFRNFVAKLDPTYVIPTRKAVKAMVKAKYEEEKQKAKLQLQSVTAVSLTSDMWTSINMDAYLALTCHYIDASTTLRSTVLGVEYFPDKHTAVNLAAVITSLMEEWGIGAKVTCLVTDGAANMLACGRTLRLRHAICVAHTLNLIVKKCLDLTPVLSSIRTKARRLVGYFRSSTSAKEKLAVIQEQMGKPTLKLIQEVETRWNSTFQMLQRLVDQREPVGAALSGLDSDIPVLTSEEYANITGCLSILAPFHEATVELSEEKRVSCSKVIPLLKMIETLLHEETTRNTNPLARELGEHLIKHVREKLHTLQSSSIMSLPTLLDPRFKTIGFFSPTKADEAVRRLSSECANVIRENSHHPSSPSPSTSTSSHNEHHCGVI